jgi:hypothetical protein
MSRDLLDPPRPPDTSRRAFMAGIAVGLFAAPPAAGPERPGKLGYVEGQNVMLEYRRTEGRHEPLPEMAAETVRRTVDVIVAYGTPGTQAARRATTRAHGDRRRHAHASHGSDRGRGAGEWAPDDVSAEGERRRGRPLCGPDSLGHQTRRAPGRAAQQVRAGDQSEDRQGPRPDDPAVAPAAGESRDRVRDRRGFARRDAIGPESVAPGLTRPAPGVSVSTSYAAPRRLLG